MRERKEERTGREKWAETEICAGLISAVGRGGEVFIYI
jgi:hypothetical protein